MVVSTLGLNTGQSNVADEGKERKETEEKKRKWKKKSENTNLEKHTTGKENQER